MNDQIDLRNLFIDGQSVLNEERKESSKKLDGVLRVGNTGLVLPDGRIVAKDSREAILRYFGVDKDFPLSRRIMFAAGEKMEDIILERFHKSWPGAVATQQELPMDYELDGFKVHGSPDIILADSQNKPTMGVEVKMISSYWTMHKVSPWNHYSKPKIDHVAQATHYMSKFDIPWALMYIQPIDFHLHTKALRESESTFEAFVKDPKGKSNYKIESHFIIYYLQLRKGVVYYRREDNSRWTETLVTTKGIEDYYKTVIQGITTKTMPQRMTNVDLAGELLKWSMYDPRYNDYSLLHDRYDSGEISFDEFIQLAKN